MSILKDKRAVITGAASGLGAAMTQAFVSQGATVCGTDVNQVALAEMADGVGAGVHSLTADVRDEAAVRQMLDAASAAMGGIDIVVNNAAKILPGLPVQDTDTSDFRDFVDVNLAGTFFSMKHAYPYLRESKGAVLNVSSLAGVTGQADHAIYAATKGAINALTRATAVDWGLDGIRVNALCPLVMWTEGLRGWLAERVDEQETVGYLNSLSSLGYTPEASEIADVAVFLCSDMARFVTGVIMPAAGGGDVGYRA